MSKREDLLVPTQNSVSMARALRESNCVQDQLRARLFDFSHRLLKTVYFEGGTAEAEPLFGELAAESHAYRDGLSPEHRALLTQDVIDQHIEDIRRLVYRQQYVAEREEREQRACNNTEDTKTPQTPSVIPQGGDPPKILAARTNELTESRRVVREDLLPHVAYYRRQFRLAKDDGDSVEKAHAEVFMILSRAFHDVVYGVLIDYRAAHERVATELEDFESASPMPHLIEPGRLLGALAELDQKCNWQSHSAEREARHEREMRGIPESTPADRRLPLVETRPPIHRAGGQLGSHDHAVGKPTRAVTSKR